MDGTELLEILIDTLQEDRYQLAADARREIYLRLLPVFEETFGDTALVEDSLYRDDAFDRAVRELHPEWYQDQDDPEE